MFTTPSTVDKCCRRPCTMNLVSVCSMLSTEWSSLWDDFFPTENLVESYAYCPYGSDSGQSGTWFDRIQATYARRRYWTACLEYFSIFRSSAFSKPCATPVGTLRPLDTGATLAGVLPATHDQETHQTRLVMKSALSNLNLQNSIMREAWRDLKKKKKQDLITLLCAKIPKKIVGRW